MTNLYGRPVATFGCASVGQKEKRKKKKWRNRKTGKGKCIWPLTFCTLITAYTAIACNVWNECTVINWLIWSIQYWRRCTYKVCLAIALNDRIQSFLSHICLPQYANEKSFQFRLLLRHRPKSVVSGRTTGAIYRQHSTSLLSRLVV